VLRAWFAGEAHLNPFYYRNDYLGVEQWSRFITNSSYAYRAELHRQHEEFAKLWDKNLRSQGFAEVFTDISNNVCCVKGFLSAK
jgi:hypothetical protein